MIQKDQIRWFKGITDVFVDVPSHQELALNHLHPMYGTGKGLPGMNDATDVDAWAAALNVRKAMSHITDRGFIVDQISIGLAIPATTSMPRAAVGYDLTIPHRAYSIIKAKEFMTEAGLNYDTLTDSDNDGVYETSFFEITVLSPNTKIERNEWSENYILELPKIGIGVKEHISTGWAEIGPRTFGWKGTGGAPVPLYDDEGYDVLFVGHDWSLDYDPQELYREPNRLGGGDGNFYNFDLDSLQTDLVSLIRDYLSELDFTLRNEKVKLVQLELYEYLPAIPIIYPISQWGFRGGINGYDALLLSQTSMEWDRLQNVRRELILTNNNLTMTGSSVFSSVSTVEAPEPFDTPSTTSYEASFLPVLSSILILLPILVLFNRRKNRFVIPNAIMRI